MATEPRGLVKPKRTPKRRRRLVLDSSDDEPTPKPKVTRTPKRRRRLVLDSSDDEPTPTRTAVKRRRRLVLDSSDDEPTPKPKVKRTPKRTAVKRTAVKRRRRLVLDSSDDEPTPALAKQMRSAQKAVERSQAKAAAADRSATAKQATQVRAAQLAADQARAKGDKEAALKQAHQVRIAQQAAKEAHAKAAQKGTEQARVKGAKEAEKKQAQQVKAAQKAADLARAKAAKEAEKKQAQQVKAAQKAADLARAKAAKEAEKAQAIALKQADLARAKAAREAEKAEKKRAYEAKVRGWAAARAEKESAKADRLALVDKKAKRKARFLEQKKQFREEQRKREAASKADYDAIQAARAVRKKRFEEERRKYMNRRKDEEAQREKARRALDRAMAEEAARVARREANALKESEERQKFLFGAMSKVPYKQGDLRIVKAVQKAQVEDGVRYSISCPRPGNKPSPFAYQRFVSHAVKPNSPIQRLLAVHRTGAGKTLTMVRILENFYEDRRSKAVVFPNRNVAHNFYSELLAFDNRYRTYMENVMDARDLDVLRANDKSDPERYQAVIEKVEKKLAGTSELKKLGTEGYLVAPIRAFSYGEIGGSKVFNNGKKPKEGLFSRDWNLNTTGNPLDNCIILMDEAHNLIQPGHGCGAFCDNWLNLQEGLAKMRNSVLVGFTATPMAVDRASGDLLMSIIRGLGEKEQYDALLEPLALKYLKPNEPDANPAKSAAIAKRLAGERAKWAGYTSYYYAQPSSQYPAYLPQKCVTVDITDPIETKYKQILTNNKWGGEGVLPDIKPSTVVPPSVISRLQNYCNIARGPTTDPVKAREYLHNLENYDLEDVAPKFVKCADKILQSPAKSLVIVDRGHSMVALTEVINMRAKQLETKCEKRCWAKLLNTTEKFDAEGNLIESDENKRLLAEFNDFESNSRGERIKTLVIDAKTYSEGVSFFGVTELHIINPSMKYSTHLQQLGRVFRACKFVNTERDVTRKGKKREPEREPGQPRWVRPEDRTEEGRARARRIEKMKARRAQGKLKVFATNHGETKRTVVDKQTIKVFVYRMLSDEFMTADEYALLRQDESKRKFIADMSPYEQAALDKGLYDDFEGKFKTGKEPTCLEDDANSDSESRTVLDVRKQAKMKKQKEEMRAAQNADREARLAKRR